MKTDEEEVGSGRESPPLFPTFHETATTSIDLEGDIQVAGISDAEDESTLDEPIISTIKRDLHAIGKKFLYVLVPRESGSLLRDWDLWGPLILCILLAIMLQGGGEGIGNGHDGGPQFSEVFVIVWLGASIVTLNSKLLGGTISFFQSVCVLGYCVLPLTVALIICSILQATTHHSTAVFAARCVIVLAMFVWSTWASTTFLGDSQPHNRKALAVYPICLFYFVISWLIVSHN